MAEPVDTPPPGSFRDHLRHLWSRRWVRGLTYLVAAGAGTSALLTWTVNRPFFNRWILEVADRKLREEMGLGLQASRLDISPLLGRVSLERFSIGEDLLQAERLEVVVDPWSLLGKRPLLHAVRLDRPRIRLDQERLARIRLKPKERPEAESPKLRLELLAIQGGRVLVKEPAWGLPKAEASFSLNGVGLGPNHLVTTLTLKDLRLDLPHGSAAGSVSIQNDLSESLLRLKRLDAQVGPLVLRAQGQFLPKTGRFSFQTHGNAELAQTLTLATGEARAFEGRVNFHGKAEGSFQRPAWSLDLLSESIRPLRGPFHPGRLQVAAKGTRDRATLQTIRWESPDGVLNMEGSWTRGRTTDLKVDLENLDLNPVATWSRVDSLRDLRGAFLGEVRIPGDPWSVPRWDRVRFTAKGSLDRFGTPMGDLDLDIRDGQVDLRDLSLRLDALQMSGQAQARLGRRGLDSLRAEGFVLTDAARVSDALKAWKVVDLDMAGHVQATAEQVSWNRKEGLQLRARSEITGPRWHGAAADRVTARVEIHGEDLTISDILAERREGRGAGDIWLTWAKVPPGQPQMDMCFRADRLPVAEGIRAADLELPLSGLGSGWVRLHGPYARILVEGEGLLEDGTVYGMKVPGASASLHLDLAGDRLQIPEVRIAGSVRDLRPEAEEPQGPLALRGRLDMDLRRETWAGFLQGSLDTNVLGLRGPQIRTQVRGQVHGPWISPCGPLWLPNGWVEFDRGRLALGEQSLEGLEGRVVHGAGRVEASVGLADRPARVLEVEGRTRGGQLEASLALDLSPRSLDLAPLVRPATRGLVEDLLLQAKGSGQWRADGLSWAGQIDAFQGRFTGFDLVQARPSPLKGDLQGAMVDLQLEGRARPKPGETAPTGVAALHLSGEVPFNAREPLSLKAQGSSQLETLKTMLDLLLDVDENSLLAQLQPQGTTRVDLLAGGTLREPTLDGFLELEGGRLQLRTYPQGVEDLAFRLAFKGRDILLDSARPLRGKLAQGDLTASGKATWQMGGLARYDIQGDLRDFQLRDLPGLEGLEMNGSLQARLWGNDEEGGILKGTLDAERVTYRADIRLADLLLNSSLASSGGLEVDDPLSNIALDLDLVLRQPWFFDTNLLKLEGRPAGSFKVLGSLLKPGLKGKMMLVPGGRVTNLLPAGDIVLERGDLDFTDPFVLNPVVNLQGRVDVPPYLVNLSLSGTLDQLTIIPTSTPSLRQDEVVAILIDPTLAPNLGTGGTPQGTLNYGIASASTGLLTSLALASFQEWAGRTFNLDRVNVAFRPGTGVNETSLTLGKTLPFFGSRVPFIYNYRRAGSLVTMGTQAEWRVGNWVMQFGFSANNPQNVAPTGEIRYTWTPKR